MREAVDAARVRRFMAALGREGKKACRVYFTGGASAVLLGWRASTIDLDIKLVADDESLLKELPRLKEELRVNVELASPDHFIPALPGWESRSVYITAEGPISFFHYDFYAQALAKLERGHAVDLADCRSMLEKGLVERVKLRELHSQIEPELYRFPAVDGTDFRAAVLAFIES